MPSDSPEPDSFGLGLGVAILIEKTSDGPLALPAGKSAGIRLGSVEHVLVRLRAE